MDKVFTLSAWNEYIFFLKNDRSKVNKINELLEEIEKNNNGEIEFSEALLNELEGFYSIKIDLENRLIYKKIEDAIIIVQCKFYN